jgi:hypothetical protein
MKVVNRSFSHLFVFLIALIALPRAAFLQTTHSFRDGNPRFVRIDRLQPLRNVRVDSTIGLLSQRIVSAEAPGFSATISGIDSDFVYLNNPVIQTAEDIDDFPAEDIYMITDAAGRKVFAVRRTDQFKVFEFNTLQAGSVNFKPVDVFLYSEGGSPRLLITDQDNHRVMRVNYVNQQILWQYGSTEGNGFNQLSRPSDAVRLPDSARVLICDSGNNRVLIVDEATRQTVWTNAGVALNNPVDVEYKADENAVLVTDQSNHRVILIRRSDNQIVFQFGETGVAGSGNSRLNAPKDADILADGTFLICDTGNRRLLQVDRQGQIVYSFHRQLNGLFDADRLPDNRTLAIFNNLPNILAYESQEYVSVPFDLARETDFDSLYFQGSTIPSVTSIRLQLRASTIFADLASAPWRGPGGDSTTFYTNPASLVNAVHDGSRFYQYKASLITNDVLRTPVLAQVRLVGSFFETDSTGIVTSQIVADSSEFIITNWATLSFNTILPVNPALRNQIELNIRLLDGVTGEALHTVTASNAAPQNLFSLNTIPALRQKQSLRLQAVFNTNSSSATPILDDVELAWEFAPSTASTIALADSNGLTTTFYRAGERSNRRGAVFVILDDPNLQDVQDTVNVQITTPLSREVKTANLVKDPTGIYKLPTGLPIRIVSDFALANNDTVEARDRDTLTVTYRDPTDPTDVSISRALVLRNVPGVLEIINAQGAPLDTASVGTAVLFLRLSNEFDRDFSAARDTVRVTLRNNVTSDVEEVQLLEVQNASNSNFTTGKFLSVVGMPVVRAGTSVPNNGQLESLPGNQIGAEFRDLDNTIVQDVLNLFPEGPGDLDNPDNLAFDFRIAPNPFRVASDPNLKLRVYAFAGDVELRKIEIYNMAGDRLRTLDAGIVALDRGALVRVNSFATSLGWWDLRAEDGSVAPSGTYFAKIFLRYTSQADAQTSESTTLRKFIILQ